MNLRKINNIKIEDNICNKLIPVKYGNIYPRTFMTNIENYSDKELAMFIRTEQYYNNYNLSDIINAKIYNKFYTIWNSNNQLYHIAIITEKNTLTYINMSYINLVNKELYKALDQKLWIKT